MKEKEEPGNIIKKKQETEKKCITDQTKWASTIYFFFEDNSSPLS